MKSPKQNTPGSFCELVVDEVAKHSATTNQEIAKMFRISPSNWMLVRDKKLPDFASVPPRKRHGWTRSITRICDVLSLDLSACLTACRIEKNDRVIEQGRNLGKEQQITKEDLEALLEIAQRTGRPVPLSFAMDYLRLLHPKG